MNDTPCGCKTCPSIHGGYQVHMTLSNTTFKIKNILYGFDVELLLIENYPIKTFPPYREFITSKNYKNLSDAIYEMGILQHKIQDRLTTIQRFKIEASPINNEQKYLYKEYHVKIGWLEVAIFQDKGFFISQNIETGQYFASRRQYNDDEPFTIKNVRVEHVIFDSNPDQDFRLLQNV